RPGKRAAAATMTSLRVLGLMLCLGTPAIAPAQDAARNTSDAEESANERDIIITATKVATNVQDTPIAVTAVTAETLANSALTTTAELGNVVPNANFREAEGVYGPAVTIYLRGVGQGDPQLSGEPAVAFYIDDI